MKLNILNLGQMDYPTALSIQESLLFLRQKNEIEDTLVLVEHPPTLTLGKRGEYSNILLSTDDLLAKGVGIYEVNRGGDVTYHGPGQVVGYPIIDLNNHGKSIKEFVWNMEEVFICLLREQYKLSAHREDQKYTGVWVDSLKITAIGIAVKHWVTMHGFAFNINTELEHFKWINPCGITDKGVTSLQKLLGRPMDFDEVQRHVIHYFCQTFKYDAFITKIEELL